MTDNVNNYYSIYTDKVLQLASTIVIKSTDAVNAVNQYVSLFHGVDSVNESVPSTWKLYMNLAGEYHFTDTPMTVISLDTLETIEFTKANLLIHRATAKAYQYGTRQYQELVEIYPTQKTLIRGILYPIDIDFAIAAQDGQILGGFPPGLVEVNEYTFLEDLQTFIYNFKRNNFNRGYTVSDNLYVTAHLAELYLMLIPAIMTIRKSKCKTNEAHSYHVRQYLASHGYLDSYIDQMTTAQTLAIYRNICYIERNAGKRMIFSYLIDKLLTERSLPLAEFDMRHDVSAMPNNLSPNLFFQRTPLNLGFSYDTQDQLTLDQMLAKEQPTARDNAKFQPDLQPDIDVLMTNSLSNDLKTKALESAMVDYTDESPYTLPDTLLNHWLWLSSQDLYVAVVNVENPRTGERIALPAKDSYLLMWYMFCRTVNIVLETVPILIAQHVQRIPTPMAPDLLSVVDTSYMTTADANNLLQYQPVIQKSISIAAFYELGQEIWTAENIQRKIVASEEHYMRRGYLDNMMNRIYCDALLQLAPEGTLFSDWFAARNIDLTGWTATDFETMYLNLYQTATGLNLTNTPSVVNLQKAMIGMLQQLSSYSIQFMSSINSSSIVPIDWPAIRLGDINDQQIGEMYMPFYAMRLKNYRSKERHVIDYNINCAIPEKLLIAMKSHADIVVPNLVHFAKGEGDSYVVRVDHVAIGPSYDKVELPAGSELFPIPGADLWEALTNEQKFHLKDVYGTCN